MVNKKLFNSRFLKYNISFSVVFCYNQTEDTSLAAEYVFRLFKSLWLRFFHLIISFPVSLKYLVEKIWLATKFDDNQLTANVWSPRGSSSSFSKDVDHPAGPSGLFFWAGPFSHCGRKRSSLVWISYVKSIATGNNTSIMQATCSPAWMKRCIVQLGAGGLIETNGHSETRPRMEQGIPTDLCVVGSRLGWMYSTISVISLSGMA